jgi:hypothetical protein
MTERQADNLQGFGKLTERRSGHFGDFKRTELSTFNVVFFRA